MLRGRGDTGGRAPPGGAGAGLGDVESTRVLFRLDVRVRLGVRGLFPCLRVVRGGVRVGDAPAAARGELGEAAERDDREGYLGAVGAARACPAPLGEPQPVELVPRERPGGERGSGRDALGADDGAHPQHPRGDEERDHHHPAERGGPGQRRRGHSEQHEPAREQGEPGNLDDLRLLFRRMG
ncbi:hypothetical protein RHRU231_880093 [Rhodococcus ruber]|uniref:Uncharacterized protein n=1 Tax=Rhodococcus ruber TaxID=1830 RepID=A0A098BUL5_9NOCA|nr:hypothetical protein RHRU231_880093 [Rhodococcus ruber]